MIACLLVVMMMSTLILAPGMAFASRIGDLCEIQGARGNDLTGIGLIVGLAGTGDKAKESVQAQQRMLSRLDIDVQSLNNIKADNAAVVIVTGTFPAFAKEGTRFDVQVSSNFDCESLEGGILLSTHLKGADGKTYAVAQGSISIGGFNADGGGGAKMRQNHSTVGRVPLGAYVEREIPSTITDGERINLLLKRPDFTTASNIQRTLNDSLGEGSAMAFGAGTVNVKIPYTFQSDLVSFIAQIQAMEVKSGRPTVVVINERTGTIVVGGDVTIKPCQVAHANLTIQIGVTPILPAAPVVGQETRQATQTDITVTTEDAYLLPVEGTSAQDVAMALNRLKVTPRDMIAIFQALKEAGSLEADLEIM